LDRINLGTGTGAGAGEIKASGELFALNRGKGLQAQIDHFNVYEASNYLNLSTSLDDIPGVTVTFTPDTNEYAYISVVVSFNQAAGTAACVAGDALLYDLLTNGGGYGEAGLFATGNIGSLSQTRWFKIALTASTAYTIKVQARNSTGARGRASSGSGCEMMVWRVAR
jgi:hypothetical protein